jgi:glyoxylase-like metal-dependent hydrolase (beta-lactamase superfamily II)
MSFEKIAPGVHAISLGYVNAILLEDGNGPVIVDTGFPDSAEKILDGLQGLGHAPQDVQQIIVTHKHIDHTGSLADLKQATGAPAAMHPVDAASVRVGESLRPVKPPLASLASSCPA